MCGFQLDRLGLVLGAFVQSRYRLVFCSIVGMLCGVPTMVYGHEGHQPLPTKGIQINRTNGQIRLSPEASRLLGIKATLVDVNAIVREIITTSIVESPWSQQRIVVSPLAGRLQKIHVRSGEEVRPNQVLAEIESVELEALRNELKRVNTEWDFASKLLSTLAPAARAGSVTGQRLLEAEASLQRAVNSREVLHAKIRSLRIDPVALLATIDDPTQPFPLVIRSEKEGTVRHVDLYQGKFVDPNEHLFEIVEKSTPWIRVDLLERDIGKIRLGQLVRLRFAHEDGQEHFSRVQRIAPLIDAVSGMRSHWCTLEAPSTNIQVGKQGLAIIPYSDGSETTIVPKASVCFDGAQSFLFVEEFFSKDVAVYRKRNVSVIAKTNSGFGIHSGELYPGDRVVVQGNHELASLFTLETLRMPMGLSPKFEFQTERVSHHTIAKTIEANATIEVPNDRRSYASSQMDGLLRQIFMEPGQAVHEGDVLAEVSSLAFQDLQLSLVKTELELRLVRNTLDKYRSAGNVVPPRTLLENEFLIKQLESERELNILRLRNLGISESEIARIAEGNEILEAISVRAPRSGRIAKRMVAVGTSVRADDALLEIIAEDRSWIHAVVGQRDASEIRIGQRARVQVGSNPMGIEASVVHCSPIVEELGRHFSFWLEWSEPQIEMVHGMKGVVHVILQTGVERLAIPIDSVLREGINHFVFVQKEDGEWERRRVQLGIRDDRRIEVVSGLTPGEVIVAAGVSQFQTAYASVR